MTLNDLLADYYQEAYGFQYVEHPMGFFMYRIANEGKAFDVMHFYIKPEYRANGNFRPLAEFVESMAQAEGCETLNCSVFLECPADSRRVKIYLNFGFFIKGTDQNFVYLEKVLK